MYLAIFLTALHFAAGAVYFTMSMIAKDINSLLVFLVGLPLTLTLFVFYCWILVGISSTIHQLQKKKQSVKLLMYKRLSKILTVSVIFLFLTIILNAITWIFKNNPLWIPKQWLYKWLGLDGLLNFNYLVTFLSVAFIWLPSEHNLRLSLEQLGTEGSIIQLILDGDMDEGSEEGTVEVMELGDWATLNLGVVGGLATTLDTDCLVDVDDEEDLEALN